MQMGNYKQFFSEYVKWKKSIMRVTYLMWQTMLWKLRKIIRLYSWMVDIYTRISYQCT